MIKLKIVKNKMTIIDDAECTPGQSRLYSRFGEEVLQYIQKNPDAWQAVFNKLDSAYHEAFEKEIGIYGSSYTNTMMVELGERLHFASGSDKNIKLTTKDDLEMFKAYLKKEMDKR